MSVISPQAMLLWATLSSTLLLFLVQHLYRYDRFQCLKWRSSSDGGFKRFMTYSYIISVPLLTTYSVAMAVMKYQAGYIAIANPASTPAAPLPRIILPKPTELWPEAHQKLIFPLYVIFAVAWALEIVSHLEELCFWLFMIKEQGGEDGGVRPWFRSFEYKLWCCGSVGALILLPLVAIQTRNSLEQVEAWTFFAGSVGSLIITLWFAHVLWKFPAFLKRIEAEDAEPEVIVRLVAFQDLNRLRIVFRLMFVVPLLVLACDGLKADGPHIITRTAGAVDILAMIGGIGCVVSSVITLLIFFPRSIAREAGYATRARTRSDLAHSKSGPAKSHHTAPPDTRSAHSQRGMGDIRSIGSSNLQSIGGVPLKSPALPPAVHRRTMSGSAPTTPGLSDPLAGPSMPHSPGLRVPQSPGFRVPQSPGLRGPQSPGLRAPRHPFAATPEPGVQVTVQTTTRGDSSYFARPTVTLGDEELPAYVGEGLAQERLPPHPNQRFHESEDYFAASGPSVIRAVSSGSQVMLARERRGLHPLLVNYTSPIDLHASDDVRIGRAF